MQYLGDYEVGETIDFTFVTTEPDTGAPATLSGTPAISAYVGNSTTQITAGITLTADFDTVTGLNHVRAVLTSGNGYADDTDISFVITTGTVDAVSAVGYVVGRCTIGRSSSYLRLGAPAGASVSADVAAVKTQTAAIEADTQDLQTQVGTAGAGLTNINLPNQTMDITGNITGNLSGSVGSVTGAVGSVTGNVGGNVTGTVQLDLTQALDTTPTADTVGDALYQATLEEAPKKNVALADIPFYMADATDGHSAEPSLTVTAQVSKDGGTTFSAAGGTVTEAANGIYYFDATQADMNADVVLFRFSATGARDAFVSIKTVA